MSRNTSTRYARQAVLAAIGQAGQQRLAKSAVLIVGDVNAEYKLHGLDIWRGSVTAMTVERSEACVCCCQRRFEFLDSERGSSSTVFCGRNAVQVTPDRPIPPDFARLTERLGPLGSVTLNGLVLEFTVGDNRLVVFPDGRVLVMGTIDTAEARSLVAKYVGS